MGVRKYYFLHDSSKSYIGPSAFYRLIEWREYVVKGGFKHNPFPKSGTWRKQIVPLWVELRKVIGASVGQLKTLKARNLHDVGLGRQRQRVVPIPREPVQRTPTTVTIPHRATRILRDPIWNADIEEWI